MLQAHRTRPRYHRWTEPLASAREIAVFALIVPLAMVAAAVSAPDSSARPAAARPVPPLPSLPPDSRA